MIPRYQRILFLTLLGACVVMSIFLYVVHLRNRARLRTNGETPLQAQYLSPAEPVTLEMADDDTGAVTPKEYSFSLPQQSAVRLRAILEHLLAEYTLPGNNHPVGDGVAVEDVYLVQLPIALATAPTPALPDAKIVSTPTAAPQASGEIAMINLRSGWVDAHPAGITTETLTVQSIIATVHDAMPEVTQVRFLVDGQPRGTLAGNVIFDRVYDVASSLPAAGTKR